MIGIEVHRSRSLRSPSKTELVKISPSSSRFWNVDRYIQINMNLELVVGVSNIVICFRLIMPVEWRQNIVKYNSRLNLHWSGWFSEWQGLRGEEEEADDEDEEEREIGRGGRDMMPGCPLLLFLLLFMGQQVASGEKEGN